MILDTKISHKQFAKIILNRNYRYDNLLPSFKTIERNRRKVFEKNEWLKPIKVTKARENLEKEFIEYSKED